MTPPAAPRRLHVGHAVVSLEVGGLERIVVDLARVGVERGHRVTVICLERPGELADAARRAGAAVVCLDKPPGRVPGLTAAAAKLLAGLAPDVVHTHQVGPLWYLGPAAGRAVVVHTEHIDNVGKAAGVLPKLKLRWLWHRAARHAGRFCGVSADVAASAGRYGTVPRRKLAVVLNGIDTARYDRPERRAAARAELGVPADAPLVGTVGRLSEVKRQDLLLRAARQLPGVHVVLVGDGPERENLVRLAGELGLAGRAHFAGYRADPELVLPAFDVFALTSRLEGLPLSLLEAWAAGLPVVSTAVGGVPKVVRDGANGLLVASGDGAALAAALARLLADPAAAARLGAAGRDAVRADYSLKRMADEYEGHYRALIAGGA